MSALYGRLQGNRGHATRCGSAVSGIQTSAETWRGSVDVYLEADGSFLIEIGPKHGGRDSVGGTIQLVGNVGDDGRNCYMRDGYTHGEPNMKSVKCIKRSKERP